MPTLISSQLCDKSVQGTGIVSCPVDFGQPQTVIKTSPNWTFDPATETFDFEYVRSKVQDGTFYPFLNTVEFVQNTPEPTTKEFQGGDIAVIRNGKPNYSFEFDNGIYWHAAAYSHNGFKNGAIIFIDKAGNVGLLRNVAETQISAFKTNFFNIPTYMFQAGDETAKTMVTFQIANEESFNRRFTVISVDEVGSDLNEELQGVLGVQIKGTASVANGFVVDVTANMNKGFGIEALTADNFRIRNTATNAVLPIDTVVAGTPEGNYAIETSTAPTLGATYVVETYDTTATPPVNVALVGTNQLYKGVSAPITAVA